VIPFYNSDILIDSKLNLTMKGFNMKTVITINNRFEELSDTEKLYLTHFINAMASESYHKRDNAIKGIIQLTHDIHK